ncbi:transcription factor MYB1R1-like [Salvia splendens]|uniref:transcription factor MYB1R1-like n=1 Tax=Salvia splendens TaxID=180675 RepID=UPI001C27B782|nr:transcription factor MYB1R1-like [Salvia splendens]
MNNLSDLNNPEAAKEDRGYASADDAAPKPFARAKLKRGSPSPWTVEEHKRFLIGLGKLRRGDWKGISRNYVMTRTPSQVASHAQKYFLYQRKLNHRPHLRRSSIFDMKGYGLD